jgi:hypothetical protein
LLSEHVPVWFEKQDEAATYKFEKESKEPATLFRIAFNAN